MVRPNSEQGKVDEQGKVLLASRSSSGSLFLLSFPGSASINPTNQIVFPGGGLAKFGQLLTYEVAGGPCRLR